MKSAVFGSGSDSSLPPLIGAGGGLVCESVGKANMLSAHFDGKQLWRIATCCLYTLQVSKPYRHPLSRFSFTSH